MAQPTPLYHANGGEHYVPTCAFCGASLVDERERAAAHSVSGTKFFCRMEPGTQADDSCYMQWRRRQH